MRLFPTLAQGAVAVLVGLMARDMGGRRGAQILATLAAVISPVALTTGMLIQYMSFDYLWWVLITFFTVRLLATEDPRWWLGIGAGIGLGMQTKYFMAYFVIGLAAGILLTPARRYLRSPWLWAGAGVALLLFLPNLIWQAQHDFISLRFLSSNPQRADIQWGRTFRLPAKAALRGSQPVGPAAGDRGPDLVFLCAGREAVPRPGLDVCDDFCSVSSQPRAFVLPGPGIRHAAGGWRSLARNLAAEPDATVRRIAVGLVARW